MTLRLRDTMEIDNLRGYPAPVVEALRQALSTGVVAVADPKRAGFYELTTDEHAFYIHVPTPVASANGGRPRKVLLLAHWTPLPAAPCAQPR